MKTRQAQIQVDDETLAAFCQRNHIRWLGFFGSVLRPNFGPASDIDVLVEFEDGHTPGFGLVALQDELSELLGRPVDLHTPKSLSREFRDTVISHAQVRYAAASAP